MTPEKAPAVDGALIGHSIDERYRLEGVIGVGGLGSVYRATHTKLQRPVAVKMLHETFGESQVQRGRFAREAKALAALQHPNIVAVLDYGVSAARPYLVMELLEGETLAQRLQRGPLAVEEALRITQQVLEALSFMHRAQLVHRDVKPSNVFLQLLNDGQERVKVLDLGLAKFTTPPAFTSGDPTLTREGAIVGTPAYMSPEQATGEAVDARSDVYAVGVIMYRMLAGRLPFEGDAIEQVRSHLIAPVPDLGRPDADPAVDPALEKLIRHAMAKRREDRFADAGQMLRALVDVFPQYVRGTLPEHEVVLPDPFAVDAINAEWLLSSDPDDSSEVPTSPRTRPPERRRLGESLKLAVNGVGRAIKTLVITSVRLFAGVSVLLVIATSAIIILLWRDETDRAELNALQRRLSDRLIERSLRGGAGEPPAATDEPPAEPDPGQAALHSVPPSHESQRGAAADPPPLPPSEPPPLAPAPETTTAAATDVAGGVEPASLAPPPPEAQAVQPSAAPSPPVAETPAASPSESPSPAAEAPKFEGAVPAKPDASPQPTAAAPVTPPQAAPSPVAGVPPARDPWQAPVPPRLRAGRKAMLNGMRGSEALILSLRDYNRAERADPRGHLILAQLYLNRFWRADALAQFSFALQLDPSARGAPEVLPSLLVLVRHGEFSLDAERLIASRFGTEAVPAIEAAMAEVTDPQVVARFRRLKVRASNAVR